MACRFLQTIEVGVMAKWTNRGAGHHRERQPWRERHGTEQQMPATGFATPSFVFAEADMPFAAQPGFR
jgi:hypothetical protein